MKLKLKFYKMLLSILIILTSIVGVMIYEKNAKMIRVENDAKQVLANIVQDVNINNGEPISEIKQEIKGHKVVGIIKIPKIDIEYPILEITSVETLKLSITKFWGNQINEIGNVTLAGHNNLNGTMLGKVDELEKGDVIELTDIQNVTLKYEVFDKYVIVPNDIKCILPVDQTSREVTLITCENGDKNRLIIKAREMGVALKEDTVEESKLPEILPGSVTIEKEKLLSETKLNWNNSGLSGAFTFLNSNDFYIYYDNLDYIVEHYYEGIDEPVIEVFEGNEKGKVIDNYREKAKKGYKFDRVENIPLTISENQSQNIIKVYYVKEQCTITFKPNNGEENIEMTLKYGDELITPVPAEKEGYTFVKWNKSDILSVSGQDMTYEAQWKVNQYTITYKVDGKTYGDIENIDFGATITAKEGPEKEGYKFIGWDSELPLTMPAKDIVLSAKYSVNSYAITYKVDGQVYGEVEEYEFGEKIADKKAPSKEGYTFIGWEPEVPATMFANNIVVNAKFLINSYTITYKVDGKTYGNVENYDYGEFITLRDEPSKDGYIFSGWDKKLPAKMPAENIVISGTFKAKSDAVLKMSKSALNNGSEITNYIFNPDSTNTFIYRIKVWNTVENSKTVGTKTVTDTLPLGIKVNGSLPSGVTKTTLEDREVLTWKVSNIGYGETNAAEIDIPVVIEDSIFKEQSVDAGNNRSILDIVSTQDSSKDKYVNVNNQEISGWESSGRVSDTSRKKVNLYIRGVGNTSASSSSGYIYAGSVQLGTSGLSANREYASSKYQESQINSAINSGNIADMLDAFVTANEDGTMNKYIYGGLPSETTVNANLRNLYKDSNGYPVFQLSDTQVVLWYCINSNVNDRMKRYYEIKDSGTKIFSDYVLISETTYHMDGMVVDITSLGTKIPSGVSVTVENIATLDDLSAIDVLNIYYKSM